MTGGYRWHEDTFLQEVAARRGLAVAGGRGAPWRLSGGTADLPWTTTLTPASNETGPHIVWRCAALRAGDDAAHQLRVAARDEVDGSALGNVEGGAAGLLVAGALLAVGAWRRRRGTTSAPTRREASEVSEPVAAQGVLGTRWSVLDPSQVLDAGLRPLFEDWPTAWWGPGDERPASLTSVWLGPQGLDVTAGGWWCCAAGLDRLIDLGETVALRLRRNGF